MMMLDDGGGGGNGGGGGGGTYEFAGYARRPTSSAIRLEPLLPSKCICGDRRDATAVAHLIDFTGPWTLAEEKHPAVRLLTRPPTYFRLRRSSTPDAVMLNSRAADFIRRSGVDRRNSVSQCRGRKWDERGIGRATLRGEPSPPNHTLQPSQQCGAIEESSIFLGYLCSLCWSKPSPGAFRRPHKGRLTRRKLSTRSRGLKCARRHRGVFLAMVA